METPKTKGTKRPKKHEDFEDFDTKRVWLEADDEFFFVDLDEKEEEDKLVIEELNDVIPLSQSQIHLLEKKRLRKRRLGNSEKKG